MSREYRRKILACKSCGVEIVRSYRIHPNGRRQLSRQIYCEPCKPMLHRSKKSDVMRGGNAVTRGAVIRDDARRATKHLPKKCAICGYSIHVEVCHIKPVKDFSPDALISEINALSNLALLCRNHHWELDHGKLEPKQEIESCSHPYQG